MNTKHSVNVISGKRSMFRRVVSAFAAASVLTLGVASAYADGNGSFSITTIAGMGDGYTGKLDVKGSGKFTAKDDGGNIVFTAKASELNMADGRQKHTVGGDSKLVGKDGKFGGGSHAAVTLTVEKSKLTFPEAGKEASGSVPGTLNWLGKSSSVTVKYKVKEDGGKYTVVSASFDFDYTKHVADGKKVCLAVVCVKPTVTISISNATINTKK